MNSPPPSSGEKQHRRSFSADVVGGLPSVPEPRGFAMMSVPLTEPVEVEADTPNTSPVEAGNESPPAPVEQTHPPTTQEPTTQEPTTQDVDDAAVNEEAARQAAEEEAARQAAEENIACRVLNASADDQLDVVVECLTVGVDVNCRDGVSECGFSVQSIMSIPSLLQRGCTPLMLAAYYGHASIVGVLLKAGADVDVKDSVSVD